MSKQYLTLHTIDAAHPTDIFSLAASSKCLISASGSSSLKVFDTDAPDFPLLQTIEGAHKLGCHHVASSQSGQRFASVGFEGAVKIWTTSKEGTPQWEAKGQVTDSNKAGETWAIALSEDGRYLASTTFDGRINVWDLESEGMAKIREYETKGSFGTCVDLSLDGAYTASGHQSGSLYIFNNDTGRLMHAPHGLIRPVRSIRFSPGNSLLAAAGDSRIIGLYSVSSGEQVATLSGHASWVMSLSWSTTGEWLLSGGFDGKAKVWSIEGRQCVATHSESDNTVWSVTWLPKASSKSEMFAIAGAGKSISFYREASGG